MEQDTSNITLPRKRVGRPPKNLCSENDAVSSSQTLSTESINASEVISLSASSPLPSTTSTSDDAIGRPSAERRRSSRKKVIKFDVRDLLNKNRKTHKIQIEARIDSNAPPDHKTSLNEECTDGTSSISLVQHQVTPEEMLVKKKTFMEKSAIFRRYSISMEQPKQPVQLPLPPPPLPLVSNAVEIKQMIPSSLILAQMENATHTTIPTNKKKKQSAKIPSIDTSNLVNHIPQQQKKRGRPPKNKTTETTTSIASVDYNIVGLPIQEVGDTPIIKEESIVQWSPRSATNWKEYKAAIHQSTMQPYISTVTNDNDNDNENAIIEVSVASSTLPEEIITTESQLPPEMLHNADEPDITSSPYEEIIIETTNSPSAIIEAQSNFFQEHFYTNDENTSQSHQSTSICPTKIENYKSVDARTDMLINEQLVNSTPQTADNGLLNEFSTNSHGDNSNEYNFTNKLRVNVKRALPSKTSPSTVYNINTNEETSKNDFEILHSDISTNIEIETDTNETEKSTMLEPFCHPIGPSTSKVVTFTANDNDTTSQSAINVKSSSFVNQMTDFNNIGEVVVEEEECHDTIVMSDDGFDADVIVIDESSSTGTYNDAVPMKTTPQVANNDYGTYIHKTKDFKEESNQTAERENMYQCIIANDFTEVAAHETMETVQDNAVVVDQMDQSTTNNSPNNVVVVKIGDNQSNVLDSSDMANIANKDTSLKSSEQTTQPPDIKEYANVAEETLKEISYADNSENNESSKTIVKSCKKLRKSRFKNLFSPEHNVEEVGQTSILQNNNEINEKVMNKNVYINTRGDTQCDSSKVLTNTKVISIADQSSHSETQISEERISHDSNNFKNDTYMKEIETTIECEKLTNEKDVSKKAQSKSQTTEMDKFQTKETEVNAINPMQCQYDKDPSDVSHINQSLFNSITMSSTNSISGTDTKLDTNVVHQVHIETNTLLDILRQVQTNNEATLNRNVKTTQIENVTDTITSEINQSSQNLDNKGEKNIRKPQFQDDIDKIESEKNGNTFSDEVNVARNVNVSSVSTSGENDQQTINEINNVSVVSTLTNADVLINSIHDNVSTNFEQSDKKTLSKGSKSSKGSKDRKKTHLKKSTTQEKSSSFNKQEKLLENDAKKGKNKTKIKNRHKEHLKEQDSETKPDTSESKSQSSRNIKQSSSEVIELQDVNRNKDVQNQDISSFKRSTMDEKLEKKRRQSKLKEAFEAALNDNGNKKESALSTLESSAATIIMTTGQFDTKEKMSNVSAVQQSTVKESSLVTMETSKEMTVSVSTAHHVLSSANVEDDSDPLKDIEKFIEDGVNLLKKDYKIEKNNIDTIISTKANNEQIKQNNNHEDDTSSIKQETDSVRQTMDVKMEKNNENDDNTSFDAKQDFFPKEIINTFETPADTPIATPSVTPPPKSPIPDDMSVSSCSNTDIEENSGVRRSHRIKQITKTPKALVGRGLVRDKERFSIKDDVEMKIHYSLDDHLTDLAEVEAKNAKFLKDMEERLSNFHVIKENEYKCERVVSKEAKKMICDCFLTIEEEERGELGCGEDCLNRLLMIECGPDCNVKERCTNKRFQKSLCSPCRVFRTEKKGFGILADIEILPGEFIMEYVGEVIDSDEFERRRIMYSRDKNRHYYFMALRSDAIIDATIKGNISRFINHSCDPNAETQKWTVNGELRIGFFSRKSIMPGEEITFDYQYQRYGREAQRCYCESTNCRGWIGQEPTSDEGEQVDDDSDFEEDEEDSANLLVGEDDEEEDSDGSVPDPEEVQKKLEMAAAEAEAELGPITLDESKLKELQKSKRGDLNKSQSDIDLEDSKSKFKNLLNKMAEKVAAKQKQNKRERRLHRKQKTKKKGSELVPSNKQRYLEDPDIEDEVEFLKRCGVKNQSDTLRLSRLMVRAKLVQTRLHLLEILRKGELPCRRLFLDYHGLRLVHGWMSEDGGNMQIRLALLQTLETLPIANKTVLTDTKVLQVVRSWCGSFTHLSPNDDSSKESCASTTNYSDNVGNATTSENSDSTELQKLAAKLISTWDGLPEIFRIPKKERIEQMKEHEREADRQYAASAQNDANKSSDRYQRDRFGRGIPSTCTSNNNRFVKPNNMKTINTVIGLSNINRISDESMKHLSKAQRRKMFAARVAREEADKRLAEERREFETKCRFFGLDPKLTRPHDIPFCVDQFTGQWYSLDRKPIATPPIYAHVQLPVKPKSTDPADYQLPAIVEKLPPQWKYSITSQGKIYYYHVKYRISQWEPPTLAQLKHCELEANDDDSESELCRANDSSDDEDDILIGMDAAQLKAYIEKKVEARRQKRYQRLVDERAISPRREEDRIYNQMEVRKYKENKEKIRKRKEGIRRKRAEALRQSTAQNVTVVKDEATNSSQNDFTTKSTQDSDENSLAGGVLPIQDYLLSSDEEDDIKAECNNSPLIDKIVEGDKIVDELDALTTKRPLKRPLPSHRNSNEASTTANTTKSSSSLSSVEKSEYKKRKTEKKEKRRSKDNDVKYRKLKEKFRCEIAGIIVHHLKPYRKDTCTIGRIQSNEDFNHLARKLTHFVMIKELKYCESVGQTLIVTESVKNKSREFIKKYMAKYGDVYVKPNNDPEFKEIPYTL